MLCNFEAEVDTVLVEPVRFATLCVTLNKQAHIELLMQAADWKSCRHRATSRAQLAELEHRRALEKAALREVALRSELDVAQPKIRDLQQRVFGLKSERNRGTNESQDAKLPGLMNSGKVLDMPNSVPDSHNMDV